MNNLRLIFRFKLFFLTVLFFTLGSINSISQVIKPSGESDRPSSQLVLWYDQDIDLSGRTSVIQVTNTSQTDSIVIHVQIFSNDPGAACLESDFVDILTPSDTHTYNFSNIFLNDGSPSIFPEGTFDNSKGFVVITPVAGIADLSAVSFQHLTGNTVVFESNSSPLSTRAFKINSMGRDAVNFTDGEVAPDGTVLDGINNGFVLIQPEEVVFNINNFDFSFGGTNFFGTVDVIGISFRDSYSDPGLVGYLAQPIFNLEIDPFLFDFEEDPASCPSRFPGCFMNIGISEQFPGSNLLLSEENLCDPITLPNLPTDPTRVIGWSIIFVSDYEEFDNFIGLYTSNYNQTSSFGGGTVNLSFGGADWMFAKGDETIVERPASSPCGTEGAIIGTPGDDVLNGTDGNDIIIGLGGNDTINGLKGDDCIDAGSGNDTVFGNKGDDNIFGGDGDDTLDGGKQNDVINGNDGDDEINGGNGTDNVNGGNGTDSCVNSETTVNCE